MYLCISQPSQFMYLSLQSFNGISQFFGEMWRIKLNFLASHPKLILDFLQPYLRFFLLATLLWLPRTHTHTHTPCCTLVLWSFYFFSLGFILFSAQLFSAHSYDICSINIPTIDLTKHPPLMLPVVKLMVSSMVLQGIIFESVFSSRLWCHWREKPCFIQLEIPQRTVEKL